MQVRFPDGTVRYGHYGATADVCGDCLHDEPQGGRDHDWYPPPENLDPTAIVPVRIAVDYGNGFSWDGRATPTRLLDGHFPFGLDRGGHGPDTPPGENYTDGLPDWWV